jgi:serine-type D-Ala-D-Ala carboxypeptidase (penicillin-binding protein 5/6)
MRSALALAVAALCLSPPALGAAPAVQARAYVVVSSVDGHTLAARNATTPRAMASITKLMTALVAMERLSLDETVVVPRAAALVGESTLRLRAGQRVTVRDLLIGTLVPSANDAATALAAAAGGSVQRFVQLMNAKARALGLVGTHFRNPHGLDEPGHVSTARDTTVLLHTALRVPLIRKYAGMPRARLSDGRVVESTDNLIGRSRGFVAGKTGHTALAGWSQVAFARVRGIGITVAVLGSPTEGQRDRDLEALLEYGLASYRLSRVVDTRRTYAVAQVGWGERPIPLVAPRTIVRPAPTGRALREQVVARAIVSLPVAAGQQLGTVVVRDGSRVVARSPLVAAETRTRLGAIAKGRWIARRTVHHLVGIVR